ncbi:MAG: glycosyltransferase family 2 protein [Treponema sp.]|nr:glycosyltransferase family 2 protein [Treponema sp.]
MLLSIIIPAYNVEKYISSTLKMLTEQGLNDSEIIVIDDGSKDKTLQISKIIASKNKRIKVIHQDNKGVSVARNVGIQEANGEYLLFMDADDTLSPESLDFYRMYLQKYPDYDIYGFGYKSVFPNKNEVLYSYDKFNNQVFDSITIRQTFLAKKICFNICSCIYKSEFIKENKLSFTEGLAIGEDIEFLLKSFSLVNSLIYSSRIGFTYLIRDDSVMQGYKFFSEKHWHSYEVRRNICLSKTYQNKTIQRYSNFFLKNEFLSHLIRFLKSDCKDVEIINNFIKDQYILSLPSVNGALKNTIAVRIARVLPLKPIIQLLKGK